MKRIDCEVIRDLLPLYVEDMASEASRRLVEDHLEECEDCRRELEEMRAGDAEKKPVYSAEPLRELRRKWKRQVAAAALPLAVLLACVLSILPNFLMDGVERRDAVVLVLYMLVPIAIAIGSLLLARTGRRIVWVLPVSMAAAVWLWCVIFDAVPFGFSPVFGQVFLTLPCVLGTTIGFIMHLHAKLGRRQTAPDTSHPWKDWYVRHKRPVLAAMIVLFSYAIVGILCLIADAGDAMGLILVTFCLVLPLGYGFSGYVLGLGHSKYKWSAVVLYPVLTSLFNFGIGWNLLIPFTVVPTAVGLFIGHMSSRKKE